MNSQYWFKHLHHPKKNPKNPNVGCQNYSERFVCHQVVLRLHIKSQKNPEKIQTHKGKKTNVAIADGLLKIKQTF
jgi:hypothetical protein